MLSSLFTKEWLAAGVGQKGESTLAHKEEPKYFFNSTAVSHLLLLPVHSTTVFQKIQLLGFHFNS